MGRKGAGERQASGLRPSRPDAVAWYVSTRGPARWRVCHSRPGIALIPRLKGVSNVSGYRGRRDDLFQAQGGRPADGSRVLHPMIVGLFWTGPFPEVL